MGSHMSSRSPSAACEQSARALETAPPPFPAQERPSSPPTPAALAYLRGRDADGRMQSLIAERVARRAVVHASAESDEAFGLLRWAHRHIASEADLVRLAAWAETRPLRMLSIRRCAGR